MPIEGGFDQSTWTATADSNETGFDPGDALLGFWDMEQGWISTDTPFPHHLIVDMQSARTFDNVFVTTTILWGTLGFDPIGWQEYELYVSTDGVTWGSAIAAGSFASPQGQFFIEFASVTKRYLKLVALAPSSEPVPGGGTYSDRAALLNLFVAATGGDTPGDNGSAPTLDFVDRYASTLASGYTAGATSLVVASAPDGIIGDCHFHVIVKAEGSNTEEVLLVTHVMGPTFAVEGGQAGTTPSDHASGAVIFGSILTGSVCRQLQGDLLSNQRPTGKQRFSTGKQETFGVAATMTLLDVSGKPGYVADMWVALSDGNQAMMEDSTLTITVDGEVLYSGVYARFFGALFYTQSFMGSPRYGNRFLSDRSGQGSFIPIPFSNSIKITLTNAGTAGLIWWQIGYSVDVPNLWPYTRKLRIATGAVLKSVDQVLTIVDESDLPPGRYLGLYILVDSFDSSAFPATAPLEGKLKIYSDGEEIYESSGTEDYFKMAGYFAGISNGQNVTECITLAWKNSDHWAVMRFHDQDPIRFAESFKVTLDSGYSTIHNYTGQVKYTYMLFYYTEG